MFENNLEVAFSVAGLVTLGILGMCIFYLIYIDAKSKNSDSPVFWALAVVVFVPNLLIYLWKFTKKPRKKDVPINKYTIMAGVLLFGSIFGTIGLVIAPAGPVTSGRYATMLFPVGLVLGVILYKTKYQPKNIRKSEY